MKINYYCYCVEDMSTRQKYLFDMKPFIHAMTSLPSSNLTSRITYNGEHLYMLKSDRNFYLFVQTKSNEVIKKIQKIAGTVSASEIAALLGQDESIGFASYIYFDPHRLVFALAGRLSSPKVTAMQHFFDAIFMCLGLQNYRFVVEPMLQSTPRNVALNMRFLGKTRMMLNQQSVLFSAIADMFGGSANNREIIGEIEVIIKPKARENAKEFIESAINSAGLTGINGIIVRAKENLDDKLRDLYIDMSGAIFDEAASTDEGEVYAAMMYGLANNETLNEKVANHEQDTSFSREVLERISHFNVSDNWPVG